MRKLIASEQASGSYSSRPLPKGNADVEAEGSDLVEIPELREVNSVQFDAAGIIGDQREHAEKSYAVVVGLALYDGEGAAKLPVLAKFELVAKGYKLRQVCARILVRANLGKGDTSLVIPEVVVKADPGIYFVIQVQAVNGLAIGVVREPVDVEIELIEIESEICRRDLLR